MQAFERLSLHKQRYYDALDPKPVWPMQMHRINAIYGTMKRTIRQPQDEDKAKLKQHLLMAADDFDTNCTDITKSQLDYDKWFNRNIAELQSIPFSWTDAGHSKRKYVTFGLAQKFLNLTIKDWWCMSADSGLSNYSVLHAPFDRIMWDKLWALTEIDFPSLKQGGYYVYLSRDDYDKYQQHLLSPQLWSKLRISEPLTRIEVEQLVWGS